MILNENHKEFAVKCYAKYMKNADVTAAFMKEFADDLPKPPPVPLLERQTTDEEYEKEKKQHIDKFLLEYSEHYLDKYGDEGEQKFIDDAPLLEEGLSKEYDSVYKKEYLEDKHKQQLNQHQQKVKEHYKKLKQDLSNQLRRLNRKHHQFPKKYRELFNQTRKDFFKIKRNDDLEYNENIRLELETIYSHAKDLIFEETESKQAIRHINTAHNILKSITAHNVINEQLAKDNTQEETKQLTDSSD